MTSDDAYIGPLKPGAPLPVTGMTHELLPAQRTWVEVKYFRVNKKTGDRETVWRPALVTFPGPFFGYRVLEYKAILNEFPEEGRAVIFFSPVELFDVDTGENLEWRTTTF